MNLILEENRKEKASAALQLEELKKEIEDFRIRRESLNEVIRKEREMESLQDSHRIQLSDFDKEDIHFLVSLEDKIHNKELLHKLIWTEYLQKPFNQMINRICGANIPKNVVYCIENIETHEKYIGKTLEVLIDGVKDGVYQGRAGNNKVVHIMDDNKYEIGQFIDVKIDRVSTWCMFGHCCAK